MKYKNIFTLIITAILLRVLTPATYAAENKAPGMKGEVPTPSIVPMPMNISVGEDVLVPAQQMRIVTSEASLEPLAKILAAEISLVTEIMPKVELNADPNKGDIELVLTREGKEEAYKLTVGETVKIEAKTYQGMAYGTTTLVQAFTQRKIAGKGNHEEWVLPFMTIEDEPSKSYRGVLIDVARRYNSPRAVKLVIQLARFYKIRYITLHLTDDQAWTFPLKSFPKAGSENQGFRGPSPRLYTHQELVDMVKFADERGVTLVPEIEFPAHCNSIRRVHPEDFNGYEEGKALGLADMANPRIYPAIRKIYAEVSEVFASSPYIHIGCDEANIALNKRDTKHYKKFMADRNLKNVHDLFQYFAVQLDKYAKENGKTSIFWADGLQTWDKTRPNELPKDMVAMDWRSRYKSTVKAKQHLEAGHRVINAVWTPLYSVNMRWETLQNLVWLNQVPDRFDGQKTAYMPKTIYEWSPYIFYKGVMEVEPTDDVIGSQMCAWESGGEIHIAALRRPLAAMAERVWNLDAGQTYEQFEKRLNGTNSRLDVLIQPLDPFKWGEIDDYKPNDLKEADEQNK